MESTGDLVGALVEFSARVEGRHHDLAGGTSFRGMHVGRNAAAVVDDGDTTVLLDRHDDLATESRERLVDRIVDDLVDEMVQTIGTCRPDIHRRAFSDWFEAFQDLDRTGVVAHCETF